MQGPLADRIRPQNLDEVVGQQHLLAQGGILRRIAASGTIPNLIFFGPPGTGKTTVARIIARQMNKQLHKLNGTTASTADIKDIIGSLDTFGGMEGVILYLDEIQYLNKKQQQTLLEFMENGKITLIASTTENPYFYVYNAILSRSTVLEFKPVTPEEIKKAVVRGLEEMAQSYGKEITADPVAIEMITGSCGGDVRKAINTMEALCLAALAGEEKPHIHTEDAEQLLQKSAMLYDKDGDQHYDILSAFQKSIRGSDENAALHYLARLLEAGDLKSPCRRLLVTASEDIGLAYPMAITIVKSCVDAALQLGMPEARIPLAQAVILLCTAPKSNSGIMAIEAAMSDVQQGKYSDIPAYLRDGHYEGATKLGRAQGYKYPHEYGGYIEQQYLPDAIKDKIYYEFGTNKTEAAAKAYRQMIKDREKA